jgi:AraC-like DNA-binding protein
MDDHFADDIDLDKIADEAFFSKFHFIRLFKKIYKRTPHQHLTLVRIEKAKELLRSNMISSEVCWSVGFDSITSFTGLFKKMVGVTPALYQLQQQQLKKDIVAMPLKFIPNCFAEKNGWVKNSNIQEVR